MRALLFPLEKMCGTGAASGKTAEAHGPGPTNPVQAGRSWMVQTSTQRRRQNRACLRTEAGLFSDGSFTVPSVGLTVWRRDAEQSRIGTQGASDPERTC